MGVWQAVEQTRIQTESEIASLISRRGELQRQIESIVARQQELTSLEAAYNNLAVEREVLQTNVKALATRQEEVRSATEMSAASASLHSCVRPRLTYKKPRARPLRTCRACR